MPLEPDAKQEVAEMIDLRINKHHQDIVMPLHRENLSVFNSFREELRSFGREVQALSKIITEFFSEQKGAAAAKKEISDMEANRAASLDKARNLRATWTSIAVTIILVIVTGIGVWIAYRVYTLPSSTPVLTTHDPSIKETP